MNCRIFRAGLFILKYPLLLHAQQDVIRNACAGKSITEGSAISSKEFDSYPPAPGRYLGTSYDCKILAYPGGQC